MTTNEPMSEQALTMIRELLADDGRQWGDYSPQELYRVGWSAELLLVEVDRLRARKQALADENAAAIDELKWQRDINQQLGAENEQKQAMIDAMRPMVEALATHNTTYSIPGSAEMGDDDWCVFHEGCCYQDGEFTHDADCPVTQARAFVAAHPTSTAAAENETESAGGDDEHPGHD